VSDGSEAETSSVAEAEIQARGGRLMIDQKPQRVLIIEDEWLIAEGLEADLAGEGFEVVGCGYNLSDGIELVHRVAFDVAILDMMLGHEKSYPIATSLMKRNIPFLVVSGYTHEDLRDEFRDVPLLNKPVTSPQLISALRALLSGEVRPPAQSFCKRTTDGASRL